MHLHPTSLIAHRGESYDAPENTLASVNLAWQKGAQIVEVDVRMTGDNEICVIHDKNTKRTTGKNLTVKKAKLDALKKLDAGSWKGEEFKGEPVPGLKEILDNVPKGGTLVLDLKGNENLPERLSQYLAQSHLRKEQVEIIAFNWKTLIRSRQLMPHHKMLWLLDAWAIWGLFLRGRFPGAIIERLREKGIEGVNMEDSCLITKNVIQKFSEHNIPVYIWTINKPRRAAKFLRNGAQSIATDRASWMQKQLKGM